LPLAADRSDWPVSTPSGLFAFSIAVAEKAQSGRSRRHVAWDWLLSAFSRGRYKIKRTRMQGESPTQVSTPTGAVFLSYPSQDAEAAQCICEALRAGGIEVWFDKNALRGGDAWDRTIRQQIRDCSLFIPLISEHSQERLEGYFRLEWKLAVDRSHRMAAERTFIMPVVIDSTRERDALVPDAFRDVQWTHLNGGEAPPAFVERVCRLLAPETSSTPAAARPTHAAFSTGQTSATAVTTRRGYKPVLWAMTLVFALTMTYFAADRFLLSKRTVAAAVKTTPASAVALAKSIAVLPFVDLSEEHDQEYFGDGMAEEILDLLAKVPQLTVIGRTSSFQFKGRTEDLRSIGEKLGAAYLVEGSVRRVGSRIRVTAQLIDARSGAHVWSDSYDRHYGDVLTLQDEIATAIARALQLSIDAHQARPLRSAQAIEAYTLYLKGKLALDKFDAKSLLEAQNLFEQALALDPTLIAAAEGLALTYMTRGDLENDIGSREAFDQAERAAQKALQMSTSSATAYSVLGFVAGKRDFEWTKAENQFRKALALNPNDPDTLNNAGEISTACGKSRAALQRFNASLALDPLNPNTYQLLALELYLNGDYSAAESALRKSLSINSDIDFSHYLIGAIRLLQGRREEALREFEAEIGIPGRDAGLALVNHALGRKAESDAALARLVNESGRFWPYGVARVHAYRGEHDQAFEWLEQAYTARDEELPFGLRDPYLVPLHGDVRWSALIKKMNLAE
jgi:TolB-like protein/Flp pilus assembly protein TadD